MAENTACHINPVIWFEIYVDDMPRAVKFYQSLLGINLTRMDEASIDGREMYSFPARMDGFGAAGALVRHPELRAGVGGTIVYFPCQDCGITARQADKFGGQLVKDKMSIGQYGNIAFVLDSEGNCIGLHSM
ncbi:MAG: VOC family protein [Candidatus Symbiobacter sp.]|nr:VOC family protein [Candidatus Symbiobacter sp.]